MTQEDFFKSINAADVINPTYQPVDGNQQLSGNLVNNFSNYTQNVKSYVLDQSFLRGLLYGTIPITICILILTLAYRRDLLSARSAGSPTYKYSLYATIAIALVVPFIIKYNDTLFLSVFPTINAPPAAVPPPKADDLVYNEEDFRNDIAKFSEESDMNVSPISKNQ